MSFSCVSYFCFAPQKKILAIVILFCSYTVTLAQKEIKSSSPKIYNYCYGGFSVCDYFKKNENISESFSNKTFKAIVNNSSCLGNSDNISFGCLLSHENKQWFIIQANSDGNINLTINSDNGVDIDAAVWGTLNGDNSNACSILEQNPLSCDFDPSSSIFLNIPNATLGQKFILLVSNYGNSNCNFSLNQPNNSSIGFYEIYENALAACYSFDGNFIDSTSNQSANINGTMNFGNDRFGQMQKSAYFNGSSLLNISSNGLLNSTYTYSCWFKIEEQPMSNSLSTILDIGGYGADQGMFLNRDYFTYGSNDKTYPFLLSYYQYNTTPYFDNVNFEVKNDIWYNLVMVRTIDSLTTYIQGERISQKYSPNVPAYASNLAKIGARHFDGQYFKGYLDDVLIFNKAISEDEVASLYNLNNCNFISNPCKANLKLSNLVDDLNPNQMASLSLEAKNLTIFTNQIIEYSAGKSINLNPGFKVENGAIFSTRIGGCK